MRTFVFPMNSPCFNLWALLFHENSSIQAAIVNCTSCHNRALQSISRAGSRRAICVAKVDRAGRAASFLLPLITPRPGELLLGAQRFEDFNCRTTCWKRCVKRPFFSPLRRRQRRPTCSSFLFSFSLLYCFSSSLLLLFLRSLPLNLLLHCSPNALNLRYTFWRRRPCLAK